MRLFFYLAAILMGEFCLAAEGGLDVGNELKVTHLEGTVFVTCDEAGSWRREMYACSMDLLEPSDEGRFVTTPGIDADKVELTATWANGKTRKKSAKFDSQTGKSKEITLWNGSLFDRDLLDWGKNQIQFELLKKKTVVASGSFNVAVTLTAERKCESRIEHDYGICLAKSTYCDRYFRDQNYCK